MLRRIALALLAVTLAIPLRSFAQSGPRAEIDKAVQAWQKAFNAGDIPAVAAMYTKDALLMAPGADPAAGPEGVQAAFGPVAQSREQMQLTTTDVTASGTGALETGKWVMTSRDGKHLDHGQYLVFYKKEGGRWKIYRDIWNSSMAPKPQ
ncbi:MAG TPA: DUF4440 domain-containing protein [Gemmatimonadales bacterium]|jgi:uncharacterized protein (TIGR02246 family)|nr:DUF4440 domain-containing protein [Gemmatimonadales bacterium]